MNVNHLDARAVTQPGGLYASANDGILQALQAYFQFKDRQQQGERDVKRDERRGRMEQTNQAVDLASRLGVRPTREQLGWTNPAEMNPLLDAAVQKYTAAESDRNTARERTEVGWQNQLVDRANRLERERLNDYTTGLETPELPSLDGPMTREQLRNWAAVKMGEDSRKAKSDLLSAEIEKTKAETERALREKPVKMSEWKAFGDSGMVGLRMEDGYTALRFPGSGTEPPQYLGPDGSVLTEPQYKAMKGKLGQAVGAVNPGVDTTALDASVPAVPAQAMSTDQLVSAANSLAAPSAEVLSRNAAADYDSVNRRGTTESFQPQEVRALAERMRMRKSQPTQHAQANILPTDTDAKKIAAYIAVHGGTNETAKAALRTHGLIK